MTMVPLIRFRADVNVKCMHGTMVFWLQNDAGYTRWSPTDSRVDALLEAFRPGRDKPYTTAAVPPVAPHPTAGGSSSSSIGGSAGASGAALGGAGELKVGGETTQHSI